MGLIFQSTSAKAQDKGRVTDILPKISKTPSVGNFFSAKTMDVNGDGIVTRAEYLITVSIFRKTKAAKIKAARIKGSSVTPK